MNAAATNRLLSVAATLTARSPPPPAASAAAAFFVSRRFSHPLQLPTFFGQRIPLAHEGQDSGGLRQAAGGSSRWVCSPLEGVAAPANGCHWPLLLAAAAGMSSICRAARRVELISSHGFTVCLAVQRPATRLLLLGQCSSATRHQQRQRAGQLQ